MTRVVLTAMILALTGLTACSPAGKDYEASAHCQDLGEKPGTSGYEKCLSDQKVQTMMDQQQKEFEDMKQEQRDWTMRRY